MQLLESLPVGDRVSFVEFGFGDAIAAPFQCVHHAFESCASSSPDSIALDRQSSCLSVRLSQSLGIERHSRVCLLVERSISMVVAILAILKAGAAYVPLDGNVASRTTIQHSSVVPVVFLDEFALAEDSVYVIYTSGVPKGVEVKHGNVTNLVCLSPGNLKMGPGVRVSQLMNIGFDMAAWEILGSLCNGATLCLRGKTSRDWKAVLETVDVVIDTPSMLVPHEPSSYPNIKRIAVAGEACPQGLADKWAKALQFYNCCGPTEITIVNTMQLHHPGETVNIGKPTPNNNVYVLGDDLEPLPIGQTGLMWAGGAGITKGYLNLPSKTMERYLSDIFVNDGSLMFNTGDLGRWRPDGTLEHLGRRDDQVKVKGFRVELDGVAAALESSPGVSVAAALLVDNVLWGFVAPDTVKSETVLLDTAKIQPYYAVPTRLMVIQELPKTSNMKTDKKALRQLALDETARENSNNPVDSEKATMDVLVEKGEMPLELPPPVYTRFAGAPRLRPAYDDSIPIKAQGPIIRNFRHRVFSLYRRLFGIVFIVNLAIVIFFAVRGTTVIKLGEIVIANLLVSISMREGRVVNAFFFFCCSVPTSTLRSRVAEVYHIGGLHSSCAIAGVVWLVFFTVKATQEVIHGGNVSRATLGVTYCILIFLLGIVLFAYPTLRSKRHNAFERVHRFLGWTATLLVWCQVLLLTNDYKPPHQSLSISLVKSAAFWLLLVLTGLIVLPWLQLRKVPVRSVVLSDHAVRLYFDYVTTKPGHFTRISDNPLMEWHGFATINEPGKPGYSLVVSKAGDWTSKQILNPPTHLWVRSIPTYGVLRIAALFKRIILVYGPCAPVILARKVPLRLLWTSPDVRKTFGNDLVDSILEAAPDAVLHDTRKDGKPDMVRLIYELYKDFNAEAVCIISNPNLTRKVVYAMKSRGIPAFGAIWDS
ncbi:nonribosomal peptide synthetase 12 [Gymnopus androsaceus JB14]|uniref:Nonribosomal peptide synthetase 12 n=1 Tax=Gymnopus androsaceus JB14 TaxID=1447944 RepID=A0A6A4HB98_9AGAR|nr:nonribosomal peptide synthetase 12 [Gymnopus androsaceus JB14]